MITVRIALRDRILRLGIAVGSLGIFASLPWIFRYLHIQTLPCGFHALTGLPCLFCGGTGAMLAMRDGHWQLALYLNPLAFLILLGILVMLTVLFLEAIRGKILLNWRSWLSSRFVLWVMILALAWWLPHVILALHTSKPELVNLRNPIAAKIKSFLPQREH